MPNQNQTMYGHMNEETNNSKFLTEKLYLPRNFI